MLLTRRAQICLLSLLLLTCVVFFFIFEGIRPYYFSGGDDLHIIDIHITRCGFDCFFDSGYISKVASAYNPERYKSTFFLVDLLFPVIYTSFFLVLSYVFRKRRWYNWILLTYILGMLFDLGENGTFLYYLYHRGNTAATLTATFTTLKTVLLSLNIMLSLVLFVWGFFVREKSS